MLEYQDARGDGGGLRFDGFSWSEVVRTVLSLA